MSVEIHFFGAAGEVTGSCHPVQVGDKLLLLDCGQVQGGKEELERNEAAFPFEAADVDALILSHAHIDHCGRLPLLCKRGFRGLIYTHPATADLTKIMLDDALRLAQADCEAQNRRHERTGEPRVEPLYGPEDVAAVQKAIRTVVYGEAFDPLPNVRAKFSDAGHILGAAIVECWLSDGGQTKKLVFSGDIGPLGTPIIADPTPIFDADVVMMESTYGNRFHRVRSDTVDEMGEIFEAAWKNRGNVLIPAFAVGRSQELLYWIAQNFDAWQMKRWKIFLDSPMAGKVTDVYDKHKYLFDAEAQHHFANSHNPFKLPNLQFVESAMDSRALNEMDHGAIIIAGSGMCNGGRIVHHLKHNLWRSKAHVLIVGYQAANTLGRELVDGRKSVRILGDNIRVNAQIHTVGGLSAHADQAGLVAWYGHFKNTPPLYLVHGEDAAREVLAKKLGDERGAKVTLARPGMKHVLI
jgi:metallo-beta-lactamase family protein